MITVACELENYVLSVWFFSENYFFLINQNITMLPSQAKPSQAKPSQAKPSQAKPSKIICTQRSVLLQRSPVIKNNYIIPFTNTGAYVGISGISSEYIRPPPP
ncbi:hypothetical protein [Escherichia coli]|uniref:hypothetical protein n=2 Tax=Escherichia coli TaxID=562 RepID=UPI0012FFD36F|nr:hypothetical protein [Escherichia coli]